MKKRINVFKRKCVVIDTSTSESPDNYVQITDWANGDGADIEIYKNNKITNCELTYDELDAIFEALDLLK